MLISPDMLPDDMKKRFLEWKEDKAEPQEKKERDVSMYVATNFDLMQALRFNQSKGDLNESDGVNCIFCKNKGVLAVMDEHKHIYYERCRQCSFKRQNARAAMKG